MASARVVGTKQKLDRLVDDPAAFIEAPPDEELPLLKEAIGNFKAAGIELLDQVTPYLWMYYRDIRDQFTRAERAGYGIPEIDERSDIWEHVTIGETVEFALGHGPYSPGRSYLAFEAEVTWESEHGLQLVFEDGRTLCKVSPYDGHMTNAHAYADVALLGVIYK